METSNTSTGGIDRWIRRFGRKITRSLPKSKNISTRATPSERNVQPSTTSTSRSIDKYTYYPRPPTSPHFAFPKSKDPSTQPEYSGPVYWDDSRPQPEPEQHCQSSQPRRKRSLESASESEDYTPYQSSQRRRLQSPRPATSGSNTTQPARLPSPRLPSPRPSLRRKRTFDDESDTAESNDSQIRTPKRLKNQLLTPPSSTESFSHSSTRRKSPVAPRSTSPNRASSPRKQQRRTPSPRIACNDDARGRHATKRWNNLDDDLMPPPLQRPKLNVRRAVRTDPRPRSLSPIKPRSSVEHLGSYDSYHTI